jgi:hypothetical protein
MAVVRHAALVRRIRGAIANENFAGLTLGKRNTRFFPKPDAGLELAPAVRVLLRFGFCAFGVDRLELQFGAIRRDRISFEIRQRVAPFILRFRPAFDGEKEILVDLAAGILHPVPHFHRREFVVEIDRELFVFDRDVCCFLFVRRRRVPGDGHARLPGTAVAEQGRGREQHR